MKSTKAMFGFISIAFKERRWKLSLAMLLILGQVLLLNHVVLHQLEDAITSDNDHCSFCAIGSHSAPAATVPPILASLAYVIVFYLPLCTAGLIGFFLPLIRLRGPPTPSIA